MLYHLKGNKLLKFESIANWINSLDKMAQKRGKNLSQIHKKYSLDGKISRTNPVLFQMWKKRLYA